MLRAHRSASVQGSNVLWHFGSSEEYARAALISAQDAQDVHSLKCIDTKGYT